MDYGFWILDDWRLVAFMLREAQHDTMPGEGVGCHPELVEGRKSECFDGMITCGNVIY